MVTPNTGTSPLVPIPIADRMPLHHGAATNVAVVTSVLRLAELGYRLQFVDLLTELIEGDPHARACIQTRAFAVASRPWKMTPADTTTDADAEKAKAIADYVEQAIKRIPKWRQHVAGMLQAIQYGVTAREIMWRRKPSGEMVVDRLELVHSRRLAYDWDWNLVWTQYGQNNEGEQFKAYPGKFWTFEPSLSDEYPTREGLGRTLLYWLAFKRFNVRDMLGFIERFGKPFPDISWKTNRECASEEEVAFAKQVATKYGTGSMGGGAHADTITVDLKGNGASSVGSGGSGESTPHKAMIALIDEQISKLELGQAYTTNAGQKAGLGTSGSVFADASQLLFVTDCAQVSESIDRDIVTWIVRLNFGESAVERYLPHYTPEIEDPEDDDTVATRIERFVKLGFPLPIDDVSERFAMPLPDDGDIVLSAAGTCHKWDEVTLDAQAEQAKKLAEQDPSEQSEGNEDSKDADPDAGGDDNEDDSDEE